MDEIVHAMATSLFSFRKVFNKPRLDDWAPLAKLYYADEALVAVTDELDAVDSRREPDRCNRLVNKLRHCQDRVLQAIEEMLCTVFPEQEQRAPRDYRVKFPDDVLNDSLPGQLWFGAECLATGSNIIDHEAESEAIRPLARSLTRQMDGLRGLCKEQAIRDPHSYPDKLKQTLRTFDYVLAEFELKAVTCGYLTQDQIDYCDPCVMVVLPRLAIITGLVVYPEGPLNVDKPEEEFSGMFKTFFSLLKKLRDLLHALTPAELGTLERMLSASTDFVPDASAAATAAARRRSSAGDIPSLCDQVSEPRHGAISPESLQDQQGMRLSASASCSAAQVHSDSPFSIALPAAVDPSSPEKVDGKNQSRESESNEVWRRQRAAVLRGRFRSPEDLIHRLFVCVSGVADQLQVNFPSDLRAVLRASLQSTSEMGADVREVNGRPAGVLREDAADHGEETAVEAQEVVGHVAVQGQGRLPPGFPDGNAPVGPPVVYWVPDSECAQCTGCRTAFTLTRRRHHCRNCGRIFCAQCSQHALALPELGHERRVRVCNTCFVFRVNHFDGAFVPHPQPGHVGGAPSTSGGAE